MKLIPDADDLMQRAFWLLPALMVAGGIVAGLVIPRIDAGVAWEFVDRPESARAILSTIATGTVSVAGVTFSIIVVALTLASSQLSPRVMRTFRSRKLNQVVLGMFVATFAYSLLVLRTVGGTDDGTYVPDISVVFAVVLAIVAFGLFIAFIGQIVHALEASTIIERIALEARPGVDSPYPAGCAEPPDDPVGARRRVARRTAGPSFEVRARSAGFLSSVDGSTVVEAAAEHDALIAQETPLGDYVVTGDLLARMWCEHPAVEALELCVRAAFGVGRERTPLQDLGFSVRQLADVALRGVSPSTNDPTTAENAMNALGETLTRIARQEPPARIRVDSEGVERFVACTPDLGELVRLGFDQVRVKAGSYPVLCVRLLELLHKIDAATADGCAECARQARLIRRTVAASGVIDEDVATVEDAAMRLFGGGQPPGDEAAAPAASRERR